jgi:23S rRNA pseudouridine1911/1915/1917 synthase
MKIRVLYEDNHFIAVVKPAGLLSQGDQTGDQSILDHVKQYIKVKYKKPGDVFLGPCHRLDRPVSGVILLGRTSKGLGRMADLFRDGKVLKTYLAVTDSIAPDSSGKIEHRLIKNRKKNRVEVVDKNQPGKWATTTYEWVASSSPYHMYKLTPFTGRSHQIRVAMSSIGCPLLGDLKYGGKQIDQPQMIALHAFQLSFVHPVTKEKISIQAPLPEHNIFQSFNYPVKDL